jgi:hypothetical protein
MHRAYSIEIVDVIRATHKLAQDRVLFVICICKIIFLKSAKHSKLCRDLKEHLNSASR